MSYITWENESGPHIHFYDENISDEDFTNLLLELGLIEKVED